MSALRLEKHFFSRIEIRPNPDAKAEGEFEVGCALTLGKASDDASRYQVSLAITIKDAPDTKAKPYYNGAIEVVGFFKVAEGFKQDPDRLVQISGASLLYGAVREMVCNLTARGPWPMVSLPTMNFTPQPQVPVPEKK